MSATPRDLATPEPWQDSLQKSLARREHTASTSVASTATTGAQPATGREHKRASQRHSGGAAAGGPRREPLVARSRDLADGEAWELSLGRSRARRRASQLHFVPARTRARRLSLGTLVALTAGSAASLSDASTLSQNANPKTSPTTTTKHEIQLRNGSTGRQVRLLQEALGVKVDGIFGAETERAVNDFQSSHGLVVDGIFGPETKAALAGEAASTVTDATLTGRSTTALIAAVPSTASVASAATESAPESEAALLADVKTLQGALGVKVDGIFGPETEGAAIRYQEEQKLHLDGIVGPETWGALGYSGRAELFPPASATVGTRGSRTATATVADVSSAEAVEKHAAPAGESAVTVLQEALGVPAEGIFGPETLAAVKSFQTEHHLEVDGVVGPETWGALGYEGMKAVSEAHPWVVAAEQHSHRAAAQPKAVATAAVAKTATAPSTSGGQGIGHPVELLQSLLHVAVDGEFGPETLAAVKSFQSEHGLEVDGVVGPQTWSALGYSGVKELHPLAWALPHAASSSASTAASGGATGTEASANATVQEVIDAANEIATRPYVYGGGHGSFISEGYDCSGSVSYALHGAGLLSSPEDSTELESYGEPGPGKYITIYANAEHVWMTIDGRRFDTVALAEDGTRWSDTMASTAGFVVRHPDGL